MRGAEIGWVFEAGVDDLRGFDEVYHLEGGILKYFEEVGSAHYTGSCFVFDEREALEPNLDSIPLERSIRKKQTA